jgi:hypothetical protein
MNITIYHVYGTLSVCVCVCVTICCGTLSNSFSFSNQADKADETKGLEREG